MNRTAHLVLCASSLLAITACTTSGDGRMGLFTAKAPVVALLVDDIFIGEAIGYMDRTGTIDMTSTSKPDVRCVGEFAYTGMRTGHAILRCSDGLKADVAFNALSNLSGYGYGAASSGPVSFTYGLTPERAVPYLRFPAGLSADLSGPKPTVKRLEPPEQTQT